VHYPANAEQLLADFSALMLPGRLWCCCFGVLFAALAIGASGAEHPAYLVSEAPLPATLASIDSQWNVTFRAGNRLRVVAARELVVWGRWRESEVGPQILLEGGGIVRADALRLDPTSLVIGDATGLGRGLWEESTLPRESIRAILYQPPAGSPERDQLIDELTSGDAGEDRLLLIGGESVAGMLVDSPLEGRFFEGARAGQSVFRIVVGGAEQPLTVPAAKVRALVLARQATRSQTAGASVWLGCQDGSLLRAASIRVRDGQAIVALAGGGELLTTLVGRENPDQQFWDEITLVQPAGPTVKWLSDLKTLGYKHIPYLSIEWPFHTDHSVTGGRLRSDGAVFLKGLGMHSTSRLAYDVAGYRKFEAELALNETAGRRGSVIFKVLTQSESGPWSAAYESPIIRGGDAPRPISINLQGASRLALIVEFADRGDELDHANWLGARLIQ
jgi:hypothetical protein